MIWPLSRRNGRRRSERQPFLEPAVQGEMRRTTDALRAGAPARPTATPPCDRAPEGWTCSRGYGHEGPCAASPVGGDTWDMKQALAAPGRFYGDGGTIHGSTWLDVEVDDAGTVVAVWFRCQTLPWRVFRRSSGDGRYGPEDMSPCQLTGVEVLDPEPRP
ncbi:hypothetical protein [Micromonospora sp. 4G55]|uniref:hypothetical protein n=1 Tax=Micromonospora sp. 4G55 TaxID=2806102 RepID=UPI001A43DA6B|nr:hypothetical protein [Micromonospora sp. 4G55]MBM0257370.1 hypothetical protein [Micromonospora sp. 4G55]